MNTTRPTRRRFLAMLSPAAAALAGGLSSLLTPGRAGAAHSRTGEGRDDHPDPRPGIDGSNVLTAEDLPDAPDAVPIFDGIREIPHIADGIRCHCGCADLPGYRSLLSCYEGEGMARWCVICQGEGRLAVRRHAEGQSLDQIRRAIDARYGRGGDRHDHAREMAAMTAARNRAAAGHAGPPTHHGRR